MSTETETQGMVQHRFYVRCLSVSRFSQWVDIKKRATLKDLRNVIRILEKAAEKPKKVVYGNFANREKTCVIRVSDASYHQE